MAKYKPVYEGTETKHRFRLEKQKTNWGKVFDKIFYWFITVIISLAVIGAIVGD